MISNMIVFGRILNLSGIYLIQQMQKKSRVRTLQQFTTDSSTSQTDVRLLLNYMIIVEYIFIVLIILWFNYVFFSLQDEKMYDKL